MFALFGASLPFYLLGVYEHIGFTNIQFILPLDEELRLLLFVLIFLTEILRNFEQIYTQNTMMLVRKDIEVVIIEYNVFDVRYLVGLINIYFNFRFGVYI